MSWYELAALAVIQPLVISAPWIILGYLIAAIVREWVGQRVLSQRMGATGAAPVLTAAGVGSLLPVCSCTVIPMGIGLVRSGAARGTILTFLLTGPAISPVTIVLALGLLGPVFTAAYLGIVLSGAILLGFIGNRLLAKGDAAYQTDATDTPEAQPPGFFPRLWRAVRWAWFDLGADVSLDLFIGLTLAGIVLTIIPTGLVAQWLGGQSLLTVLGVILLAIPVYTCTVPTLPVVQSLLLAGMAPGAGLAFLIAGPATNLGELLVMRRQLGATTMWLFVGALAVLAVGAGLTADHLIWPAYQYVPNAEPGTASACCAVSLLPGASRSESLGAMLAAVPLWHWPLVAILASCLLLGIPRKLARIRESHALAKATA
jgi:uncharacterized membrane protein YraQ (UPF0718 family)